MFNNVTNNMHDHEEDSLEPKIVMIFSQEAPRIFLAILTPRASQGWGYRKAGGSSELPRKRKGDHFRVRFRTETSSLSM